jgi:WD40 repeat protein
LELDAVDMAQRLRCGAAEVMMTRTSGLSILMLMAMAGCTNGPLASLRPATEAGPPPQFMDTGSVAPAHPPGGDDGAISVPAVGQARSETVVDRTDANVHEPTWSPSCGSVAYVDYDQDAVLRTVDVATHEVVTLDHLDSGVHSGHPAWSNDGGTIAYVRFHSPDHAEIGVVDVDSGARRIPFALATGVAGGHPRWLHAPIELPAR